MARSFDGSERIIPSANIGLSTWSFTAWIYQTSRGSGYDRFFAQAGFNTDLAIRGTGFGTALLSDYNSLDATWSSVGSPISANTWYHVGFSFDGTNIVTYLNGASLASVVRGKALSGASVIGDYGGHTGATNGNQWIGNLAEMAVYSGVLSAAQFASLGAGFAPSMVGKPTHYWPLIGRASAEIDPFGASDGALTVTGNAAHPRIIYPNQRNRGQQWTTAAAAGALVGHRLTRGMLLERLSLVA